MDFYYDLVSATFLATGSILVLFITRFSRFYLHKEDGFKRFFVTMNLFFFGYNVIVLSGNFETLFIGWEIIGISSFLLIAFYRNRYLPVKNAIKVFSIYRLGDIGILLAMWASHHLWNENISFLKLNNYELVHDQLLKHSSIGIFISMMLMLAAWIKSAQFPFSYWLPRAMEGPTSSSAIFYGSLSVHFGVFLLLRTFPFWEHQLIVRILIFLMGLITAIITYLIARTQSTVKTQIAYSSISQIGLMFMEISMGMLDLVLLHFLGNAFLRTYQLLTSSSAVSYLIRDQSYHYRSDRKTWESYLPEKIQYKLYFLAINEFNMDELIQRFIFYPFKVLSSYLGFLTIKNYFYFIGPFFIASWVGFYFQSFIPGRILSILPELFSFVSVVLVSKAYKERSYPRLTFLNVIFSNFWIALAISFNERFTIIDIFYYLSGVFAGGILGYSILIYLLYKERKFFSLDTYQGFPINYPTLNVIFLFSCLSVMGFPISPSFIGEDLIFSHIHKDDYLLAIFCVINFIFSGISLIRLYSRLFLGPSPRYHHLQSIHSG